MSTKTHYTKFWTCRMLCYECRSEGLNHIILKGDLRYLWCSGNFSPMACTMCMNQMGKLWCLCTSVDIPFQIQTIFLNFRIVRMIQDASMMCIQVSYDSTDLLWLPKRTIPSLKRTRCVITGVDIKALTPEWFGWPKVSPLMCS